MAGDMAAPGGRWGGEGGRWGGLEEVKERRGEARSGERGLGEESEDRRRQRGMGRERGKEKGRGKYAKGGGRKMGERERSREGKERGKGRRGGERRVNIAIYISRNSVKVEGKIVVKMQRMEMPCL